MSIIDYTSALKLNPCHFQAYNNRGLAYRDTKLFRKALRDFDRSITLKPDLADAFWNKALTHLMVGDYENAWKYYEIAGKVQILHRQSETFPNLCG